MSPYRGYLGEKVGKTSLNLNRGFNLESTMDNCLLQAKEVETGEKMVFTNGWRFGAQVMEGETYRSDLFNMVPMNPAITTCEINGEELVLMVEENLEHTFPCDPLNQMGGYVKRAVGMRVLIEFGKSSWYPESQIICR